MTFCLIHNNWSIKYQHYKSRLPTSHALFPCLYPDEIETREQQNLIGSI